MARTIPVLALAVLAAVVLVPAQAATASPAQNSQADIARLKRQVSTLQRQVTALQRDLNTIARAVRGSFLGTTCLAAMTADLFQGTWGVVDQIAQTAQARTYFGPQQALTDYQNCSRLQSPTVPRPAIAVPPSIAVFNPLIQWLRIE